MPITPSTPILVHTRRPQPSARPGFTLIEMLVVVGIIVILAAMLIPVVTRAYGKGNRSRLQSQMNMIATALEAYKADFGQYPRTSRDQLTTPADDKINQAGVRGARLLCKALYAGGPQGLADETATPTFDFNRPDQDGADGPGFRVPPRSGAFSVTGTTVNGPIKGPYLNPGTFRLRPTDNVGNVLDISETAGTQNVDDTHVLLDGTDHPILYFPQINPSADPSAAVPPGPAYLGAMPAAGALPMYATDDGAKFFDDQRKPAAALNANNNFNLNRMLGDLDVPSPPPLPAPQTNGRIDANETIAARLPFILWLAGPDGLFGPQKPLGSPAPTAAELTKCDDVTNFRP